MFYDMHVHSTFSADGKSTLEEYAAWRDKGAVGFAEHVDFLPECGSFEYMDSREYIAAIRSLRERGCDFYAGAEIDYIKSVETDIFSHIREYGYDYTICSIHMVDGLSVSDSKFPPRDADLNFLLGIAENYYVHLEHGIRAGVFDVVGHVGVYSRYLSADVWKDNAMTSLVREAELEIARLCAGSNMIVELNTSGLFSPSGEMLPGSAFLKDYYDFGGRLVCLGSDAHNAKDVSRGFDQGADALKAAGFTYITLPWNREQQVKIV